MSANFRRHTESVPFRVPNFVFIPPKTPHQFPLNAIVLLSFSIPLLAVTRVDLNREWMFRTDPKSTGLQAHWQSQLPVDTVSVNLPHTWNLGRQDGYLGKAWYWKTFTMPMQSPDLHVKLHFGGRSCLVLKRGQMVNLGHTQNRSDGCPYMLECFINRRRRGRGGRGRRWF